MAGANKAQTIFRTASRQNPYASIVRKMLQDPALSLEASGLLVFVLSLPDNWSFNLPWLCKTRKVGRDKAQRLVRELIANRYCARRQTRTASGQVGPVEYIFSDDPTALEDAPSPQPAFQAAVTQDVGSPQPALPAPAEPAPVNPHLHTRQSTNYTQTEKEDARARMEGTDGCVEPLLPFTPDVLAQITLLGLDPAQLIQRYNDRTKGRARTIVDPSAYLLRMARDEVAKTSGVTVEHVKGMTSRNRDERIKAATDATRAFSRPSDAALARVKNCASLAEILADLAERRFTSQADCDRALEGEVVNARFRPPRKSVVSTPQVSNLKNEGSP